MASSGSNLGPRPTSFKPKGKRPVCSYCGFVGHTVDVCYKKHGFPPGYKPRPRQSQQTHQFHNSQAHQPNHQSQAHCVASYDASVTAPTTAADGPVTMSRSDWTQFQQQYQRMAQIVQQPSVVSHPSPQHMPDNGDDFPRVNSVISTDQTGPSGNQSHFALACGYSAFSWVLDTGATDHIACDHSLFSCLTRIDNIFVQLPTGDRVQAIGRGTVRYSDNLLLQDVLFIPGFSFNLISISQLVKKTSLSIIFHQSSCLIQEFPSLKMIGVAELKQGLYVLTSGPQSTQDCSPVHQAPFSSVHHALNTSFAISDYNYLSDQRPPPLLSLSVKLGSADPLLSLSCSLSSSGAPDLGDQRPSPLLSLSLSVKLGSVDLLLSFSLFVKLGGRRTPSFLSRSLSSSESIFANTPLNPLQTANWIRNWARDASAAFDRDARCLSAAKERLWKSVAWEARTW
ncbi:hypothetical protein LINPERPRIM_LOCUS7305 [Linum perenne]